MDQIDFWSSRITSGGVRMNFKNKRILVRYQTEPQPTLIAYLIKKEKKNFKIISKTQYTLEKYQLEEGLISDYQVVAEKLNNGLDEIEKGVKDGIVIIYDTPNLLRFNTILPKSGIRKAKNLAKKELNDFFKTSSDNYEDVIRIVSCRERGIIFYYDLISKSFLKSLEEVANAMNRYVDSHTNLVQGIASYFEYKDEDETDTFVVYQDEFVTHVILLFQSKLIDSVSFYSQVELTEIVSGIELLRNKHLFAFERKETNNIVLVLNGDAEKRNQYREELKNNYDFEVLEKELEIDDVLIYTLNNVEEFQLGFFVKMWVEK